MVLVDIYVPSVDKTYDFSLDENANIALIIEELAEMIGQKEHTTLDGDIAALSIHDRLGKRMLLKESSLKECGIHNGSSLLLV